VYANRSRLRTRSWNPKMLILQFCATSLEKAQLVDGDQALLAELQELGSKV